MPESSPMWFGYGTSLGLSSAHSGHQQLDGYVSPTSDEGYVSDEQGNRDSSNASSSSTRTSVSSLRCES